MKRKVRFFLSVMIFSLALLVFVGDGVQANILSLSGANLAGSRSTLSAEVVDSGEFHPFGIDMDLDDSGEPHIVFSYPELYYAHKISGNWSMYKIESGFTSYPSIALDSSGYLHISYTKTSPSPGLYYASNLNGYWEIELIDKPPVNYSYTSITLDSSNTPHISYYDTATADLKYATRVGALGNCGYDLGSLGLNNTWDCLDVDLDGDVGSYNAIALGDSEIPYISYRDATNNKLMVAKYIEVFGSWESEPLTSGGFFTSLAFDSENDPHIGYVGDNTQGIWYAYKDFIWKYEYIDASLDFVYGASLSLNNADIPSLSYINMDTSQVKYATRIGAGGNCGVAGKWQCEVVNEIGDFGFETSLQFDSGDQSHLTFTGSLDYAVKEGQSWTIEPIQANVGYNSSLTLDLNEFPAISYTDSTFADLKFARWDGTVWNLEWIASGNYTGKSSLAFDQDGYAHMSFLQDGNLKYVTDKDGSWDYQTVDSSADVGHYNAIDLDENGKVYISYFDDANDDLKYATNASGAWQVQTLDENGGFSSSIAVEGNGVPHISYFDGSNRIKYAVWVGGGLGDCFPGLDWECITYMYYGTNSDLVLDNLGNAYMLFSESTSPSSLRYLVNYASGGSMIEAIYTSTNIFPSPIAGSITLDDENNPLVVFCDGDESKLYIANRVGSGGSCSSAWDCYLLPYTCGGSAPSIALDGENNPHLSFESQSTENGSVDLMYLTLETPIAALSGIPTSGTAPLTVFFTNQSTGYFDTCTWTFGDGDVSNKCDNPEHTYTAAGVYTVSLNVSGLGKEDTKTHTDYINVLDITTQTTYMPLIMR